MKDIYKGMIWYWLVLIAFIGVYAIGYIINTVLIKYQ